MKRMSRGRGRGRDLFDAAGKVGKDRELHRQGHRGPGGPRARAPQARHVYRRHRRAGAASSGGRSARQRHGRGGVGTRLAHRDDARGGRHAHGERQRPRHSRRSSSQVQAEIGAGNHPHHAPFGREILGEGLQDRGRAAWRRALRRQRLVRMARGGSRARPQALCADLRAGRARPRSSRTRARCRTGAARASPSGPIRRSSRRMHFDPRRLYRMARSKAYLFRGVEIRWSCAESLLEGSDIPPTEVLHFPGGLADFLAASLERHGNGGAAAFHGRECATTTARRVEWALTLPRPWRAVPQFLLQHHPDARRRHA